jgi:hypothetical protein
VCSVVGRPVIFGNDYGHPTWADGDPFLVGQDVKTPEGWVGFVSKVGHEEIWVYPYGDGEPNDEDQYAPEELRRYTPQHRDGDQR